MVKKRRLKLKEYDMKNRCFIFLLIMLLSPLTWAQVKNTATEVRDYREVDGKIILDLIVNGVQAGFVLDLAGHTAILPEYVERFKIDPNTPGNFGYEGFLYKHVPTSKSVLISTGITCSVMVFRFSFWKMSLIYENWE